VPNLGDRIVADVEAITEDEPRRVRIEFGVIEMDGHRAARFALRQLDDDQSREPTPKANSASAPD
jgi:hypothetical protein